LTFSIKFYVIHIPWAPGLYYQHNPTTFTVEVLYRCFTDITIVEVLLLIQRKYQEIELYDTEEVAADLRLVLDIILKLKPDGEEMPERIKSQ